MDGNYVPVRRTHLQRVQQSDDDEITTRSSSNDVQVLMNIQQGIQINRTLAQRTTYSTEEEEDMLPLLSQRHGSNAVLKYSITKSLTVAKLQQNFPRIQSHNVKFVSLWWQCRTVTSLRFLVKQCQIRSHDHAQFLDFQRTLVFKNTENTYT